MGAAHIHLYSSIITPIANRNSDHIHSTRWIYYRMGNHNSGTYCKDVLFREPCMVEYSAASSDDLYHLYDLLIDSKHVARAAIIVRSFQDGIMRAPLSIRLGAWMTKLFHRNVDVYYDTLINQISRNPMLINQMWSNQLDWLVNGVDEFDLNSLGGWSQAELDQFVHLCMSRGLLNDNGDLEDMDELQYKRTVSC